MGAKFVVARAERDVQEKFLLRNGADEVVYPEKQVAKWAAIRYSAENVHDFIQVDSSQAIFEVSVPDEWVGKSIGQLDVRRKYNINILAIKEDNRLRLAVTADLVLRDSYTLLVLGDYKTLQKCFKM